MVIHSTRKKGPDISVGRSIGCSPFMNSDDDTIDMSQATKIVVGTVTISAALSFALVGYYAFLI